MAQRSRYNPEYENSWALVVGIDAYRHASPLGYACNDARAFADQLVDRFDFPKGNVTLLLDARATLQQIRKGMAQFVQKTVAEDRVIVFYAGHGHTVPGYRREAGYLVPVAGKTDDTSTLLPWEELVSTSNVIPAKHLLFIMDACYGGLLAMRGLAPGSNRFVRDMLSRFSRQVLTAGKADELVADSGGPRDGHSIFTGHLLDALEGAVGTTGGLLSANVVMPYVYDRVGRDPHSRQTPHYGYLDGDGDLFFTIPEVDADPGKRKDADDILIEVPAHLHAPDQVSAPGSPLERVKEYLSAPQHRIKLHELVKGELRAVRQRLSEDRFPIQGSSPSADDLTARLRAYEESVATLLQIGIVIGQWADETQQSVVREIGHVLAGEIEAKGGLVLWLSLRWYPMLLAMYGTGIAAIHGDNYRTLRSLFCTEVRHHQRAERTTVLQATVRAMLELKRSDAFKLLPDLSKMYTPQSEYLFTRMQPILEDALFLGNRYEYLFDRFEILYALSHVDLEDRSWGPIGRFGWKYGMRDENPFKELLDEVKRERDEWPPLRAGLFRGSYARFEEVSSQFEAGLAKLNWF